MNSKFSLSTGLAVLITLVASTVHAQGFANGGFETAGTDTPAESWIPAASGYSLSVDAFEGSFAAELASPTTTAAVFTQNSVEQGGLASLIVGSNPILSFQAKGFAGTTGNVLFALRYLNAEGAIVSDSGNQFFQTTINPATYTEITFDLGVVPTGADAAFLEFSQAIGPIDEANGLLAGSVLIDNIVLSDPNAAAVPEPSSAALLCLSGVGMLPSSPS